MKIFVGTLSEQKLGYVKSVVARIERLQKAEIVGYDVDSGVSDQPMGPEETTSGAKNRAMSAFTKANTEDTAVGLGLEAGFLQNDGSLSMICTVAIYNKGTFIVKTSQPLAIPDSVSEGILSGKQYGNLIRNFYEEGNFTEFPREHIEELIERKQSFESALTLALTELFDK